MRSSQTQHGFTLVELMVTAAILVILMAIAIPSYGGFVAKTVRNQAKSTLVQVADRQEQFFLDNKSYAGALTDLGFGADPVSIDRDGFEVAAGSKDAVYEVTLGDLTATTYTVRATPKLGQAKADAKCGGLTLDQAGRRGSDGAVADCW